MELDKARQVKGEMLEVIKDYDSKIAVEENSVTKFKIGDVVQLKSGGPEMTINSSPKEREKVNASDEETVYACVCMWFNGIPARDGNHFNLLSGLFSVDALKLVVDEKTPSEKPVCSSIGGGR